jgi:hypothetical protein
MFIRIEAPHFCAGIEITGPVESRHWRYAPILRYMGFWSPEKILKYCADENWQTEIIEA